MSFSQSSEYVRSTGSSGLISNSSPGRTSAPGHARAKGNDCVAAAAGDKSFQALVSDMGAAAIAQPADRACRASDGSGCLQDWTKGQHWTTSGNRTLFPPSDRRTPRLPRLSAISRRRLDNPFQRARYLQSPAPPPTVRGRAWSGCQPVFRSPDRPGQRSARRARAFVHDTGPARR